MKKTIILLMFPISMVGQTFKIQEDKQLHFIAGGVAAVTGYAITHAITKDTKKSIIYSTAFSLLVGIAKEVYDSGQPNNKFDINDVVATGLGGITFSFVISIPSMTGKNSKNKKLNKHLL